MDPSLQDSGPFYVRAVLLKLLNPLAMGLASKLYCILLGQIKGFYSSITTSTIICEVSSYRTVVGYVVIEC